MTIVKSHSLKVTYINMNFKFWKSAYQSGEESDTLWRIYQVSTVYRCEELFASDAKNCQG